MSTKEDLNRFWTAYKEQRLGLMGLGILLFFVTLAIFAPYIAPYDPHEMYKPVEHPNSDHLLGTNDIGQDIAQGSPYSLPSSSPWYQRL
jgi:ABC-type dipeptide/oligopeptide/nickel transport system permease subunit